MKFFKLVTLFVSLVSTALAAKDYQITHYGCPRKCSSQEHASCDLPTYPLQSGGTRYFCALSTHLDHYKDYCGKRVVLMLTDGSKNMINVQVVDSCSSCPQYHVDLSSYSFETLLPLRKGEADCIWGVFDDDGTKLAGPIYKSVSKAAEHFGMSGDSFVDAFIANAKKMARSGSHVGTFGKSFSGGSSEESKKSSSTTSSTTSRTKIRTRSRSISRTRSRTTSMKIVTKVITKRPTIIRSVTKTLPPKQSIGPGVKSISIPPKATVTPVVGPVDNSNNEIKVPIIEEVKADDNDNDNAKNEAKEEEKEKEVKINGNDEEDDDPSPVGALALGGGLLGAAGLGLLLMKKKSPSTYDNMKQKFPEAFGTVKRGLSRSATSIKRKVTTSRRPDLV